MKNDKIERSVKRAFVNAAPYQLDKVTEKCKEQKGKVIPLENKQAKKSINKTFARIAAAAAALLLMIMGSYAYGERYGVASTVALDVNPSIEIGVNKGEKVVYVTPKNEDGKKVIGDMKLEGSDIKVAVNALIGSMLREGYISEMANSILISVNGDDAKKNAAMQSALSAEVTDMLNTGSFQGAVLSQTITSDPETKRLAEEYGITEGKAQLIRQITENNAAHTFEELAGLSVNELNLIGESGTKSIANVTSAGTASERAYIGEAEAKRIALAHAGVSEGSIREFERELDRYLLKWGHCSFEFKEGRNMVRYNVAEVIFGELDADNLHFANPLYNQILQTYRAQWETLGIGAEVPVHHFLTHPDPEVCNVSVDILTSEDHYVASELWRQKEVHVESEAEMLAVGVPKAVALYKSKIIERLCAELHEKLRDENLTDEQMRDIMLRLSKLNSGKVSISKKLQRLIL